MKKNTENSSTKILIIDDEPAFTRMLKMNLDDTGSYEIETVNQSMIALKKALDFEPDIILLDVVMPGLDGGDLAAQIRAKQQLKAIPIIFISAMVGRSEAGEGVFMSGGERFLAKPVKVDILVKEIQEILN